MLNVTITKFTASDTDEKTPSKFPWFEIIQGVSNNIKIVYYTTDDSSYAVDIKAFNTEAQEDGLWRSKCVLVVAGAKISMGGRYLQPPKVTVIQSKLEAHICMMGGCAHILIFVMF